MRWKVIALASLTVATLATPAFAGNTGRADVAALQVALRREQVYAGPVDGLYGPGTLAAVRALERRHGLRATGKVWSRLQPALGEFAARPLGGRALSTPARGWDVAELQFLLAWRGFPSGPIGGEYTARTAAAVRRFQEWARLPVDGIAGPATIAAARRHPDVAPLHLHRPVDAAPSAGFGPRENRFHSGLDFPAPAGTPVRAARSGVVTYAGWHPGGWGYLVTVGHGRGVRTMSAHLSSVAVRVGQRVSRGSVVGAVGSSGSSSGPHLHLELRVRGAAVDPSTGF